MPSGFILPLFSVKNITEKEQELFHSDFPLLFPHRRTTIIWNLMKPRHGNLLFPRSLHHYDSISIRCLTISVMQTMFLKKDCFAHCTREKPNTFFLHRTVSFQCFLCFQFECHDLESAHRKFHFRRIGSKDLLLTFHEIAPHDFTIVFIK